MGWWDTSSEELLDTSICCFLFALQVMMKCRFDKHDQLQISQIVLNGNSEQCVNAIEDAVGIGTKLLEEINKVRYQYENEASLFLEIYDASEKSLQRLNLEGYFSNIHRQVLKSCAMDFKRDFRTLQIATKV